MLAAGRARRLVSILSQALEDCAEQKKKLEDNLTLCRALLGDWKVQTPESPKPENGPKSDQESEPSPKELEELELLNRALERALRVRKSTLRNPSEALGEGKKAAEKKPATSAVRKQQAPLSKESVPNTIKVTSACKKAVSSKKLSAYMLKAPYRTDPVKAPTSQSSRAPKVAGKGSTKGAALQQARKTVPAASVSQQEFSAAAEPSGSPRSPLQQSSSSFGGSASAKNSIAVILQGVEPENDCPGSLAESPVTRSHTAGDIPVGSTMARTFTLQGKGSSLKLPRPYRKAYSRNSRQWEKCHLCQSSSATAAARSRFLERMQSTFCSSAPAFSPAEIEEGVMVLRDARSLLSQYMEAETTGYPIWEKEYECLLTLEGLQDTASQCLHKLQLLRAAAESQMVVYPADCAHKTGTSPADCAPLRGRRCGDTGVLATPLLFYSSCQELRDMATLKLQVVMLRQQIDIQKVLIAELLPILESRLPCGDSPSPLYRAIYTQLCEGGERFPVLMNDELPD
ncbi:tubulin epsilon and delta complex protein 2 [Dermochelys coriacea]|uniref:tubulin epsilon and delta complex protein 2 n=1 Tax=Dermochelys coriacea TaxID=27794 RepID=UPI0018E8D553|nr:tubulin epsilon and delta complex protein 2 [Dermochelys coriacea]